MAKLRYALSFQRIDRAVENVSYELECSRTHSEVASHEYTTLTAVLGTHTHNGARIQVLDLPGES
jgi:GTP1/Obg family GTP-binding protein